MAALDFPTSPSLNQRYSANNATWEWNGSAWVRIGDAGPGNAVDTSNNTTSTALYPVMVDGAGNDKVPYVSTSKLKFDASAGGLTVISGVGTVTAGIGSTALIVKGDARITGILTVGEGSLTITSRDINAVGVVTGSNFKTGTTNVHNVGVEAAGINVLGADTPIGTGATVYNSGLFVGKQGAEFQGVVTASSFVGTEGEVITGVGIETGGTVVGYAATIIHFRGPGVTTAYYSSTTGIATVNFQGGGGSTGAGGTWNSYVAGIATTKTAVGISTDNLDDKDLTGIGNSFKGMYISNGMMIYDNALSGNHYIGTAFNGLMAGPVTIHGTLSVDGQYVVV